MAWSGTGTFLRGLAGSAPFIGGGIGGFVGSGAGGVGALPGAGIGAQVGSAVASPLTQFANYIDPQTQQDPYAQLRQQAIQGLQQQAPQININNLQNMLRQNLEQRIIPGIANRFSGMGNGAQRSSGFARTIGQAAGGELQQLGALLPQLQMQRFQAEQGRLGNLLGAIGGERDFGMQQQNLQQQRQMQQQDYMQGLLRNLGSSFEGIERSNLERARVGSQDRYQQGRLDQDAARLKFEQDRAQQKDQATGQNIRDIERAIYRPSGV